MFVNMFVINNVTLVISEINAKKIVDIFETKQTATGYDLGYRGDLCKTSMCCEK